MRNRYPGTCYRVRMRVIPQIDGVPSDWCTVVSTTGASGGRATLIEEPTGATFTDDPQRLAPDLTDPATIGCLAAQAREALGEHAHCTSHTDGLSWWVWDDDPDHDWHVGTGPTEGLAWLDALERVGGDE